MEKEVGEEKANDHAEKRTSAPLPPILNRADLLLKKFEVEDLVGRGGFGQIFRARERDTGNAVAVKVEPANSDVRRLKLEWTVLVALRGRPHIALPYGSGTHHGSAYIVMQLLGRNLNDIRRVMPNRIFSTETLYRVARQLFTAIAYVHDIGFLHRDIKPSNCCIGVIDPTRIYLIDFGMTRMFRDVHGNPRPERLYPGFRGTLRYMSMQMHQKKDQGPCSDLASAVYSLIEMGSGHLPWSRVTAVKVMERAKEKARADPSTLCANHPPAMATLAAYVFKLKYGDLPDYMKMLTLIDRCVPADLHPDYPYDWQIHTKRIEAFEQKEQEMSARGKGSRITTYEDGSESAGLVTAAEGGEEVEETQEMPDGDQTARKTIG